MANRRMFSKTVTETDSFYSLSAKAQSLYFHLAMNADDDGCVSSPVRSCGADGKTLRVLEQNGYIFRFESGLVVVADWYVHNSLRKDRYTKSVYQEELSRLVKDESGRYFLAELVAKRLSDGVSTGCQDGCQTATTVKDRIGEGSLGKDSGTKPTAAAAATAPPNGASGGSPLLGIVVGRDLTQPDEDTERARNEFFANLNQRPFVLADAAPADAFPMDAETEVEDV